MSIEKGPWSWNVFVVSTRDQRHRFTFREQDPDALMRRVNELMANYSAGMGSQTTES